MCKNATLFFIFPFAVAVTGAIACAGSIGHGTDKNPEQQSLPAYYQGGNQDGSRGWHSVSRDGQNAPADKRQRLPQQKMPPPRSPSYTHGRPYYWRGEPLYWHGHVYWNTDIRSFARYGYPVWRSGHWYQGWYGGRWGWWWVIGGIWYYYVAPIYPYPDPYVPGTVLVVQQQSETQSSPPAQAGPQYWYHCNAPEGYYPYVPECPGGWTAVPATPPGVGQPPQ